MKRRFSSLSGSKPSQSELRLTESTGGRAGTPLRVLFDAVAATATPDVPNANAMTIDRCMSDRMGNVRQTREDQGTKRQTMPVSYIIGLDDVAWTSERFVPCPLPDQG